jgi:DNA-binding NtrC family response regulator
MSVIPISEPLAAGMPAEPGAPIVLVVDDDPDGGEATAANLRKAGLRVRTALTAENALECCIAQPFDATVLDHHQADDYCESLLDEAPAMGLAVIVSAARLSVLADIRSRHVEQVFAVMPKPVADAELVEVVHAAVAASRSQGRR